eukprot:CFRG6674T1
MDAAVVVGIVTDGAVVGVDVDVEKNIAVVDVVVGICVAVGMGMDTRVGENACEVVGLDTGLYFDEGIGICPSQVLWIVVSPKDSSPVITLEV